MASLNRVQLLGSLANTPQLRYTPSGKGVLSFFLEVEGESANIFPIYVWGRLANLYDGQLAKGNRVFLEGRLVISERTVVKTLATFDGEQYEEEEDKYSVQIIAKKIEFLGNQQMNEAANKYTIEDVVRALEVMALNPMADYKMIHNLIEALNSLDMENTD
jgi:single-strand DNA-binding protein